MSKSPKVNKVKVPVVNRDDVTYTTSGFTAFAGDDATCPPPPKINLHRPKSIGSKSLLTIKSKSLLSKSLFTTGSKFLLTTGSKSPSPIGSKPLLAIRSKSLLSKSLLATSWIQAVTLYLKV